ncbi:MAG: M15 family metallopeptidase [bacterium]
MKRNRQYIAFISCLLFFCIPSVYATAGNLPQGFVDIKDVAPDIVVESRYYSNDNFIGERVDGYLTSRCIMTQEASDALKKVQNDLRQFSLGLKLFDAYRPQRAVAHFVRWTKDLKDTKMKMQYYPQVEKKDLFKKGYIAEKSSHSRGSTVDLTIVYFDEKGESQELDMGTGFDFFSPKSWPDDPSMTPEQRAHRMLLQLLMETHGFAPYSKEWWHFTLGNEPYPETYFDFPVQ